MANLDSSSEIVMEVVYEVQYMLKKHRKRLIAIKVKREAASHKPKRRL